MTKQIRKVIPEGLLRHPGFLVVCEHDHTDLFTVQEYCTQSLKESVLSSKPRVPSAHEALTIRMVGIATCVNISYEKILEESIYAQELLGAQKSKESTSGLLKARKILNDNFGNIHIYIGRPISLRSMASERINRSKYNLIPRHSLQRPSEEIQKFISDMAYKVELHQIANMVLSPGDLIATILLQNLPVLNYNLLIEKILWLRKLTEDFGGVLDWPGDRRRQGIRILEF
ncbi:unnamed protein product [Ranitomeya imitator]|uniref:GPAT/DHAPAT C-terminal domain-containing protein n=1 Tax=Ranitomeya imitator TaxID=111125 RepID=A0ABN9MMX0_9NEOB|nr:unnamed protein product [Ranitomeya imitator]